MVQLQSKTKYRYPGRAKNVKSQGSGNSTKKVKKGIPGPKVPSVNRKVMVMDAVTGKARMRNKEG